MIRKERSQGRLFRRLTPHITRRANGSILQVTLHCKPGRAAYILPHGPADLMQVLQPTALAYQPVAFPVVTRLTCGALVIVRIVAAARTRHDMIDGNVFACESASGRHPSIRRPDHIPPSPSMWEHMWGHTATATSAVAVNYRGDLQVSRAAPARHRQAHREFPVEERRHPGQENHRDEIRPDEKCTTHGCASVRAGRSARIHIADAAPSVVDEVAVTGRTGWLRMIRSCQNLKTWRS
jgi:hypothetical protein